MKNEFSAKRVQNENGSLKLEPPFASFANSTEKTELSQKKKKE